MKPITPIVPGFPLPITEYAKNQPEYNTLPVYKEEDGTIVSRWKLSFLERLKLLVYGDLWLIVMTFNRPLQPVRMSVTCPIDNGFNSQ